MIDLLDHLDHLHAIEEVELRREVVDAPPSLRADREQLTQALLNLLQNARDAAFSRHGETGEPFDDRLLVARDGKPLVPPIRERDFDVQALLASRR